MRILLTIIFLSSYIPIFGQVNITRLEYYIDTDPGFGSGTNVPIVTGPSIDINFNVPAGLPVGFHTLVARTQDANFVWSVQDSRVFYVSASDLTSTANIVAMEYFIDTDPGYGAGTSIPIVAATSIDISPVIPTSALPAGHHTLYVRALDSDGIWGDMDSRTFFIDDFGGAQISGIEYFIDTDPGYGAGSLIDVNPEQDTIDREVTIPMAALPAATYTVGMRIIDANGNIGITDYLTVTLCDAATVDFTSDVVCVGTPTSFTDNSTSIVGDIYNWDFDTDAVIDDNTSGDVTFTYPSAGTYTATLEIDRAGCIVSQTVTVDVNAVPSSDAGLDQNICLDNTSLAAGALLAGETGQWVLISGSGSFTLATDPTSGVSGLTSGVNEFQWEVTDPSGTCTTTDIVQISYLTVSTADAGTDQVVCADNTTAAATTPIVGETGLWTVLSGTGTFSSSTDPNATVTGLTSGLNEFQWEVSDATATCTSTDIVQVNYYTVSVPDAGPDQTICADNTALQALVQQVGETATWTVISGTGIFLDALDPVSTVSGLTQGINEFGWEITDASGTCTSSDIVQIDFINTTLADAGSDQSLCSDNSTLAANTPLVGETGAWSIVSGTGVITDATDPLSTITGITTSTIDLLWSISDGSGTCSTTDAVSLTINLPITAADASGSVFIGDTLVVDVQSTATINAGDVLTTTITVAPAKGTASVLTDGSIQFIPSMGVFGADNIDFQICNQCGNCDTGTVSLTIPNNAPVIAPDTVTVVAGTLSVSVNLTALVSDINNNADLTTLRVTVQPTSGAVATIDASFNLVIDYTGITFSGIDQVSIEVCDDQGVCAVSVLSFQVTVSAEADPDIIVYNAVTPNQDNKHDFLKIDFITAYPGNEVFIYDKIGNLVFNITDYDNISNVFKGVANEGETRLLPEGTYYYVIILNDERTEKGFLLLQN